MKRTLGILVAITAMLGLAAFAATKENTASPAPAATAPASSGMAAPAMEPRDKGMPAETERLNRKAGKAQARIQRSPDETKALAEAVRAKNTDQAREILLKNGFSKKDLADAKISFVDNTGGAGEPAAFKIKSITIKCCPLEIIITIEL